MGTPFDSGSSALSMPPPRNVNVCCRSRVKSSGPSDQWMLRLSADQCRKNPASREICATGNAVARGPMSIGRPVRANGMTCTCQRSWNATHLPSGDGTMSVAFGDCSVDDLVAAVEIDAREHELRALLAEVEARAGVVELRLDAAFAHQPRRSRRRRPARYTDRVGGAGIGARAVAARLAVA